MHDLFLLSTNFNAFYIKISQNFSLVIEKNNLIFI